ncbi:hypothetical protein ES705_10284 [subsurface metagenome]
MFNCRVCGNTENNKIYLVREMMFGTRDEFEYVECSNCGCLQIKSFPGKISRYYPDEYNAFNRHEFSKRNKLLYYLQHKKLEHLLNGNKNMVGWIITSFIKNSFEDKLVPAQVKTNYKILDVGSGTGARLIRMRQKGFENITGSDIFINGDITYDEGLRIIKKDISEIDDRFDFIMMNHSFEHVPDPVGTLRILNNLILPGKYLLIRIPVSGSYSWKEHGTNWVALDAPRHFHLHTPRSMKLLAEKTGFILNKIVFDSSEYQFIGSEQYKRDIYLKDENSYYENPAKSIFTKRIIKQFRKRAKQLNRTGEGDAACFYLYKPDEL